MPTEDRPFHCVAFAGGGSGGHLNPSIAVAEQIRTENPDCELLFLISNRLIDQTVMSASPVTSHRSHVVALAPPTNADLLRRPWFFAPALGRAVFQSLRAFRRHRPQIVLGTGGFVSVPAVLAAWMLRIPVALLELNVVPGKATRMLSRFAKVICTGLPLQPDAANSFHGRILSTGIPLRQCILKTDHREGARPISTAQSVPAIPQLLILGGSQGAARLNRLLLEALQDLSCLPPDWRIMHQTGSDNLESIRRLYGGLPWRAEVSPFFVEIRHEQDQASLVIARAGASTIAELAVAARPVILIPLSHSVDGHQLRNAQWVESQQAAIVVDESSSDAVMLLRKALRDCADSESVRHELSQSILRLATPSAAGDLMNILRKEMLP